MPFPAKGDSVVYKQMLIVIQMDSYFRYLQFTDLLDINICLA